MTQHKQVGAPNRQGQGTGSSPNRDPQYGTKGGTAGQVQQQDGKHPLQQGQLRERAKDGSENDDNLRAEKPVAE